MGGGAAARGGGRERGADLRYNLEITLEEAFAGKTAAGAHPDLGHLRGLRRHRRQGRHQAEDLPDLRRPRQGARTRRASSRSSAPARLPGPRPGDRRSLPELRAAPAASRASARSRSTSRPASRTAPASASPAKARPACAAARRATSTSSCRSRRTPFFQRDGADLHLPRADLDGDGGARRRVRGADHRRRQDRVKVPEGTQSGQQFRLKGKGMPVLRSRETRRHVRPGRGRDAAEPDQAAAGTAAGVRASNRRPKPSRKPPASSPRSRSSLTGWAIGKAQLEIALTFLSRRYLDPRAAAVTR